MKKQLFIMDRNRKRPYKEGDISVVSLDNESQFTIFPILKRPSFSSDHSAPFIEPNTKVI